ncbi:hypothetical protein EVG20_g1229 [Dentipellis fragilis]|uniref:DNA-directed RNA polymerase III subunit RPC6 n=1 Tax=Dentipellis fragilis TaxID=205917 RepID=A0A4Y9ZAG9_9AGAM|nr:hypothetical protein EVG20_g1229 [Dentipellis fragilis]
MAARKLNPLETKLHQAALQAGKPISQKEVDAIVPDAAARVSAINFLLGAGMLKLMKDGSKLLYRAVQKGEMDIKKGLSGEENMVLGHIQAAANQGAVYFLRLFPVVSLNTCIPPGIWTKHLKAKTDLHQTVIDRCLKSLVQKQLIKAVKGVDKNRTRKIYMMAHLEPSVELTGGPWYTDSELDTEFIKLLCSACLRFIKDRSFPKQKNSDDVPASSLPLYSISDAPAYPTATQITGFLSKSKITETQLTEDHVEMLLNVLILDGDVEKIPAFAAAMWDSNAIADDASGSGSGSEDEDDKRKAKSKKRKGSKESSSKSKKRKRSKESDDESDALDAESTSKSKKSKSKGKKRKRDDSDDESASEAEAKKKKKKRKVDKSDGSGSESGSDEDSDARSKKKTKSKKKSKSKSRHSKSSDESGESDFDSGSDSGSDSDTSRRKRSKSKSTSRSKSKSKSSKLRARSSSPDASMGNDAFTGSAYVYRAIRQERVALGWSEAPCGRCLVFDFCKDGGPVNAKECEYYGEWLTRGVVSQV